MDTGAVVAPDMVVMLQMRSSVAVEPRHNSSKVMVVRDAHSPPHGLLEDASVSAGGDAHSVSHGLAAIASVSADGATGVEADIDMDTGAVVAPDMVVMLQMRSSVAVEPRHNSSKVMVVRDAHSPPHGLLEDASVSADGDAHSVSHGLAAIPWVSADGAAVSDADTTGRMKTIIPYSSSGMAEGEVETPTPLDPTRLPLRLAMGLGLARRPQLLCLQGGLLLAVSIMIIRLLTFAHGTWLSWKRHVALQKVQAQSVVPDLNLFMPQILRVPAPPVKFQGNPAVNISFMVPLTWSSCNAKNLELDVIVSPAVWPLRIMMSRPADGRYWKRIEASVDVIDGADIPPLLTCSPAEYLHPGGAGCACGTHGLDCGQPSDPAASGSSNRTGAWLEIQVGRPGTSTAAIMVRPGGRYIVQRAGYLDWTLDAHLDSKKPWITVSRQGQDIGLAAKSGRRKRRMWADGDYIEFHTQPDTSSPESLLLFMSMLAVMVFSNDPLPLRGTTNPQ